MKKYWTFCVLTMLVCKQLFADHSAGNGSFGDWAATPPMGWNSYDCWGDTVTEDQVMENANYIKTHLLSSGWNYVVIDFRWYDPDPRGDDFRLTKDRMDAKLSSDQFGRMMPAVNRFPSSKNGEGFKSLADQLHQMGLKFGFHMMRGIPRQSVKSAMPIEGSKFTAADAGDPNSKCGWCPDMFGVEDNEAGQAWYDAMFKLYASWGLDLIKIDDLSYPYQKAEIEMIRKAIDRCGRPIVFSTSPGRTPLDHAEHVSANANMWRISGDFWDKWEKLDEQFDLLGKWQGAGGRGHWPDADIIPFGRIAIKCVPGGKDHQTHFTSDERETLMALWSLTSSPLMLGMHLPDTDQSTLDLIANTEVLAIDQDSQCDRAKRKQSKGTEIWEKNLADGSKAVGLFNRTDAPVNAIYPESVKGRKLRDLFTHKNLPPADTLQAIISPHGVLLVKIK